MRFLIFASTNANPARGWHAFRAGADSLGTEMVVATQEAGKLAATKSGKAWCQVVGTHAQAGTAVVHEGWVG